MKSWEFGIRLVMTGMAILQFFFRVLLSDKASQADALADVTGRVGTRLFDNLQLDASEYKPYFYFRSKGELDKRTEPEWQFLTTF